MSSEPTAKRNCLDEDAVGEEGSSPSPLPPPRKAPKMNDIRSFFKGGKTPKVEVAEKTESTTPKPKPIAIAIQVKAPSTPAFKPKEEQVQMEKKPESTESTRKPIPIAIQVKVKSVQEPVDKEKEQENVAKVQEKEPVDPVTGEAMNNGDKFLANVPSSLFAAIEGNVMNSMEILNICRKEQVAKRTTRGAKGAKVAKAPEEPAVKTLPASKAKPAARAKPVPPPLPASIFKKNVKKAPVEVPAIPEPSPEKEREPSSEPEMDHSSSSSSDSSDGEEAYSPGGRKKKSVEKDDATPSSSSAEESDASHEMSPIKRRRSTAGKGRKSASRGRKNLINFSNDISSNDNTDSPPPVGNNAQRSEPAKTAAPSRSLPVEVKPEPLDPDNASDSTGSLNGSNQPVAAPRRIAIPINIGISSKYTKIFVVPKFFSEDDVEVSLKGRTIYVKADKKVTSVGASSGEICYHMLLPDSVDMTSIKTEWEDNKLIVTATRVPQ